MTELAILVIGGIYMCQGVGLLLTATWYDFLQARWDYRRQNKPHTRQYRIRPFVTILLHAGTDTDAAEQTLHSLLKLSYRKRRILVVGAQRSNFKNLPHNKSYKFAKNIPEIGSSRGGLTLKVPSGVLLQPTALTHAVTYLNTHPQANGVTFSLRPYFYPSQSHLQATYYLMIRSLFQKSLSILGQLKYSSETPILVRNELGTAQTVMRIQYDDGAVGIYSPVANFKLLSKMQHLKNQQNIFSWLQTLPLFFVLSYALYSSVWQRQPTFLLLALLCSTLFIGMAILWNVHIHWRQKVSFVLLIPITYGYLYGRIALKILEMFADMAKAVFPVSVGLFVRIKHVRRIVE